MFASSTSELGQGTIVRQTINTNDARLIKQPPYRFALNAGARGFPCFLICGRAPRLPLSASLPLPNSCASTSVSQLQFDYPVSSPSLDHTAPDLSNSDLPPDSFASSSAPNESLLQDTNTDTRHSDRRVVTGVPTTRPEDTHAPLEIQPVYSMYSSKEA